MKDTSSRRPKRGAARAGQARRLSRLHRPDDLSLEEWQQALRRQFGREQTFILKRTGGPPIFSEFEVTNPQTRNSYRVVIRGDAPGKNFCSCPDFATNTLGTCKHIEFTLGRLEQRRGARAALARGFEPPFSEIYLQYGARREVRFRPRRRLPRPTWRAWPPQYFDADGTLLPDGFAHFEQFLSRASPPRSRAPDLRGRARLRGRGARCRARGGRCSRRPSRAASTAQRSRTCSR